MSIKTTHVGSLPRPPRVADLLFAAEKGIKLDASAHDRTMHEEVAAIVAKQKAAGVDIPSDGEIVEEFFEARSEEWEGAME